MLHPVNNGVIKGHLDVLLMSVIASGPMHGYAVIRALRERSGEAFDLPEGTIYPALHRLEEQGLLGSAWTIADGRRRRVYRLNGLGQRALAEGQREWQAFARSVDAVLEGGR